MAINLQNSDDFQSWSFSHAVSHKDIVRRIFEVHAMQIEEFVLDPFDPKEMDSWLNLHQQQHNAQNAALGIAGYNLSEVDWEDENARSAWIWANADEHYRASAILGL